MKKEYHLMINGVNYKWGSPAITGAGIRELGNVPSADKLYFQKKGSHEEVEISDSDVVDLTNPGIEKFISRKSDVTIIVNAQEHSWDKEQITYDELVILAFGSNNSNTAYTVTYSNGPTANHEGFVVKGQSVVVCDKIIFNVTGTSQS